MPRRDFLRRARRPRPPRAADVSAGRQKATPIDATYSTKFNYAVEGSSLFRTKLVPVPPPAILEQRITRVQITNLLAQVRISIGRGQRYVSRKALVDLQL